MTLDTELGGTRDVEEIERHLRSPSFVPSVDGARAVRNLAAEHLAADPSVSERLSLSLMDAIIHDGSNAPDEAVAITWRCRAEAQLFTGHPLEARRAYEHATHAAEQAGAAGELGQILVGRIGLLNMLGEAAEATKLVRLAERTLRRAGDTAYLGKLYLNQGNAHYDAERYDDAYRAYRLAYRTLQAEGAAGAVWAGLVMNLGIACMYLGRLEDAHRLLVESETHAAEHGLDLLEAHARFNRAFLERLRGNYRDALSLLEASRSVFVNHETGSLPASVDRAMAEVYIDLSMPADALPLAARARQTYDDQGMWLDARLAEAHEAVVLIDSGRPQEALARLEAVVEGFRGRRMPARRAVVTFHTARAHLELGRVREAREAAARALRTFEARGMNEWSSRARRLSAETYLADRRLGEAARVLSATARRARALPTRERLARAALAGRVALLRGRRREARASLRRAAELLEVQRRLIPGVELRARALAEHASVHHGLVQLEIDARSPRFDALLGLVEAGRARAFRERQQLGASPRDDTLASLRARLGQLAQRLERSELSNEPLEVTRSLRREIRALEAKVLRRDRRRESLEEETPERFGAVSLDAVTRALRSEESLVTFFVADDTVVALLFTRDRGGQVRYRHVVLEVKKPTLAGLIDRVRFQLDAMALGARRPAGNLAFQRRTAEALLGDLHQALLAPLEPHLLESGRLVIIPHSILHQVPFEALHDGRGYIADRWTIARAASADQFARAPRVAHGRSGSSVLAGVTSGLAGVEGELDAAEAALHHASPVVLRDPTTAQLLSHIGSARLLHISTHGTFREDNPLFSRLTTSDGALFLADIIERPSRADLVVLSACNAGQTFTGRGDDLAGLAHGFLATGARCLVASQWRVHDGATTSLMSAFYRRYAGEARGDAAAALSQAGRDVREEWDHPFYWGGFSVHGR